MSLASDIDRCNHEIAEMKAMVMRDENWMCGLKDWYAEKQFILKEHQVVIMEIFWSAKLKIPNASAFQQFVQRMANRIMQGHCSYGPPKASQLYLTRLKLEIAEYERTGNAEHLDNAANYCHLEDYEPEHPSHHRDNRVESVTRRKIKSA